MDSRQHRRVRMRLPVRLRWTTPLGQKIELAETIDVSRSGLLVAAQEAHFSGTSVWVTFPYDISLRDGQPEVAAHVVRCGEVLEVIRAAHAREKSQSENQSARELSAKLDQLARVVGISEAPATFAIAVHLEESLRSGSNGHAPSGEPERRGRLRKVLAIPVRVYPERIPWFEEAMTIDVSEKSMRFRSQREYALGDRLKIAFDDAATAPWHGAGAFLSKVVRVAPVPSSAALDVSVCRVE
ncbi:MAG TPA: PilZ domain-containing protein [Candidatus Cybelea sp.]|nr:PilZ domain-containing protein [Candidatus Cybelea sp.]